jgi:uncharacterized SAM-binding protein YcdF (DUF218 family)
MVMLHTVLKTIALPPTSFFVLLLLGWLLMKWRRRIGLFVLWSLLALSYLSTTPFAAGELMAPLQRYPAVDLRHPDPGIDAIVVLGAGVSFSAPEYWDPAAPPFGVDVADPLSLQRVAYAAYLAKATGLPILLSGGAGGSTNDRTVARAMSVTLKRNFGLSARWLEERSASTMENAQYSAEILRSQEIRGVYVVTHAWHMRRALMAFQGVGVEAVPAPTAFVSRSGRQWRDFVPSAQAFHHTYYGIYEWLGIAWYRLTKGS